MTTEQLNQARAEAWRQAGNPLLTSDDAAAWLDETAVCLFLPRVQLATAAPSFVEAVLGAPDATPSHDAIETATGLLHRLLAAGEAVALNLLGMPGEQPDFLATTETLPFLFALRGDKEWKRGPRGKSSPLVIEVWKLLDREGPLTTIEVKDKLGRQLTEAAALRALTELWSHLRIEPVFKDSAPAAWQLLERSRQKQMQAGSSMSQAAALSALVSLYLQSAVAASLEEVEVFLSPLASRSKVREVIKGLTTTRQLSTLNLGPVEMYHVEGSLPEFPEIARLEGAVLDTQAEATDGAESETGMGEGRRRFVAKRQAESSAEQAPAAKRAPRPGASRPPARDSGRSAARGPGSEPAGNQGRGASDRRPFSPRPGTTDGERRPYGTRSPNGASSFNPREPWKEDHKPAPPRGEGEEHRPFARTGEGSQAPRERRPFSPRESSERQPFAPRTGDRPFQKRASARPSGERKSFGERKPFPSSGSGERKPFAPREGGERKPFAPGPRDRPFRPRAEAGPLSDRKSFGERKPFSPRGGGGAERKPFTPRDGAQRKSFGERKTFTPREGETGERKTFAPRTGDKPFKPSPDTQPFGDRKSFGERKPFSPRSGGDGKPSRAPEGGERKPFSPREGERKSFASRSGQRPFKPRAGERKDFGERASREGGERKPFAPRSGGRSFPPRPAGKAFGDGQNLAGGKPFAPRGAEGRRPSPRRDDGPGERRAYAPKSGERPYQPRPDAKPARPTAGAGGDRPARHPSLGAGRPSAPGARKTFGVRKSTGVARARTSPTTSSGKPRSGVRPPSGRPGPRATRGGAAGARGAVKRTGRPGKGRSK